MRCAISGFASSHVPTAKTVMVAEAFSASASRAFASPVSPEPWKVSATSGRPVVLVRTTCAGPAAAVVGDGALGGDGEAAGEAAREGAVDGNGVARRAADLPQ